MEITFIYKVLIKQLFFETSWLKNNELYSFQRESGISLEINNFLFRKKGVFAILLSIIQLLS
jgi:hypothetical protein